MFTALRFSWAKPSPINRSVELEEAHMRYLRELVLPHPAMKATLEEYLQGTDAAHQRVERIEASMTALMETWRLNRLCHFGWTKFLWLPFPPRSLKPARSRSRIKSRFSVAWRKPTSNRKQGRRVTLKVTDSRRERTLAANPASKFRDASETEARGGCSVDLG